MGSGNENRKKSDTISIRLPKTLSGLEISATEGDEYNAAWDTVKASIFLN